MPQHSQRQSTHGTRPITTTINRAPDHRVVHRDVHRDWHHYDHHWHHYDHRDWHGRVGYYGAPPVVYGGPYYPPPPVDYGPGVSLNVPGLSINF